MLLLSLPTAAGINHTQGPQPHHKECPTEATELCVCVCVPMLDCWMMASAVALHCTAQMPKSTGPAKANHPARSRGFIPYGLTIDTLDRHYPHTVETQQLRAL